MTDERSSLLDDIFNRPEEEVETFMDAIKSQVAIPDDVNLARAMQDRPDQVQAPELTDQVSGQIRIQRGWHGDDYVWHISANPKRGWKVSIDRVIYATAKVMNEVIPNSVVVKIWPPQVDWDIQEVTFKAFELNSQWSVTKRNLDELGAKLFEVLNTLA